MALIENTDSTRVRIMDSAELLFSERGFSSVSLRQITKAAGVNLAAVNYHFGSKENLIENVVRRRTDEVMDHRCRLYRALPENATLRDVVRAFLVPLYIVSSENNKDTMLAKKLLSRSVSDQLSTFPEVSRKRIVDSMNLFVDRISTFVPNIAKGKLLARLHWCASVIIVPVVYQNVLGEIVREAAEDMQLEDIVSYCCGGLAAEG